MRITTYFANKFMAYAAYNLGVYPAGTYTVLHHADGEIMYFLDEEERRGGIKIAMEERPVLQNSVLNADNTITWVTA